MSDKQKQPLQNDPPANQEALKQHQNQNHGGRRGIEPDEQHRQSGHRVSDQGNRKSGGDKR